MEIIRIQLEWPYSIIQLMKAKNIPIMGFVF